MKINKYFSLLLMVLLLGMIFLIYKNTNITENYFQKQIYEEFYYENDLFEIVAYLKDDITLCDNYFGNNRSMCIEIFYSFKTLENNFTTCDFSDDTLVPNELIDLCKIIKNKEIKSCENLSTGHGGVPSRPEDCRVLINNDINECYDSDNNEDLKNCLITFILNNALKNKNVSKCDYFLTDYIYKDTYMFNLCKALVTKDLENFLDVEEQNYFLHKVALKLDYEMCKLTLPKYKYKCKDKIEKIYSCFNFIETYEKKECIESLGYDMVYFCGDLYSYDIEEIQNLLDERLVKGNLEMLIQLDPKICLIN